MQVTTEPRDGYLLASLHGAFTLDSGVTVFKEVLVSASSLGLDRILFDCRGLEGVLSTTERYRFASEMLDYIRATGLHPRTALVGRPPEIDGFGVMVFQNRGGDAAVFPQLADAVEWLQR